MKLKLWVKYCQDQDILESSVPLFEVDGNVVQTKEIGSKHRRKVLVRSKIMEEIILEETNELVEDYQSERKLFDGLIYIMYRKDGSIVVPLYIGKTETIGKSNNCKHKEPP